LKAYPSIEELAEDVGISERTAWRWLKAGKIKRKRAEEGHMVFVLANEPPDMSHADIITDVTGDVSVNARVSIKEER
jgi:predicted site-specific integrase-resolvase